MQKKLNKNVEVWRGTKTPPTTYHVWVKPDGSIHVHDGTNWKSTDEYITKEEFTTIENNFQNYINTEITKITNQIPEINYYNLNTVSGEELKSLGSNIKDAYKLVNNKGVQCGDYIKLYKDSSLKKVEFDNQILRFTYILAEGNEQIVDIDVSAFLHESECGVGLQVVDHIVSIKKDNDSESFLSISDKGIKLAGIQDAIDAAVADAIKALEDTWAWQEA